MRDIGRTVLYTVCGVRQITRLDTDEEIIKNASPQTIDPITADQRGHNKRNRMFIIGHPRVLENKRTVNNEHKKKLYVVYRDTSHVFRNLLKWYFLPKQTQSRPKARLLNSITIHAWSLLTRFENYRFVQYCVHMFFADAE